MRRRGVFLDVFLFEAEGFRGVKDEHFHAGVGGDFGAGEFRDDDHESDRERDGPDGGLFAENSNERVGRPEGIQVDDFEKCRAGGNESEVAETGQRNSDEREQAAGEHASGGAFHRHAAPPNTHEEKREVTGGGDRECLADHEVDL